MRKISLLMDGEVPVLGDVDAFDISRFTAEQLADHMLTENPVEAFFGLRDEDPNLLHRWHHGLGSFIRNTYGFWRPDRQGQVADICKGRIEVHPDEASMAVIEVLWRKLQER